MYMAHRRGLFSDGDLHSVETMCTFPKAFFQNLEARSFQICTTITLIHLVSWPWLVFNITRRSETKVTVAFECFACESSKHCASDFYGICIFGDFTSWKKYLFGEIKSMLKHILVLAEFCLVLFDKSNMLYSPNLISSSAPGQQNCFNLSKVK